MIDITSFIERQFPAVYRQEGSQFVAFVKAYYEWLESTKEIDLRDGFDVDRSIEAFLEHFKTTYLSGFPFVKASSIDFLVKHIYDYYQTKGTEESVKLLIMMMFGEDASVFKPSQYMFKPSTSRWVEPKYLELEPNKNNYSLVGTQIKGVRSGASAIVESVITKTIRGRYVDIVYISNVKGSFSTGERITNDGNVKDAPVVIGSLSTIEVTNGGRNFQIGDVLSVDSNSGMGGKVRVKSVVDSTGRVDFELIDGGSGYTTTPSTEVYISDGIIWTDNKDEGFIDLETVKQEIQRLGVLSLGSASSLVTLGREVIGVDEVGNPLAEGKIVATSSANGDVTIDISVESGTFFPQRRVTTSNGGTDYLDGDILETESRIQISTDDASLVQIGDLVEQIVTDDVPYSGAVLTLTAPASFTVRGDVKQENANGNVIMTANVLSSSDDILAISNIRNYLDGDGVSTSRPIMSDDESVTANIASIASSNSYVTSHYVTGIVEDVQGNNIIIEDVYGEFEEGTAIDVSRTGTPIDNIPCLSAIVLSLPSRAVITNVNGNDIDIEVLRGLFPVSDEFMNLRTEEKDTVLTDSNIGATDIWFDGNVSSNAVIDTIEDQSISGIIVGQNTTAIGVWGNTAPFITTNGMADVDTQSDSDQINVVGANIIQVSFTSPHDFVAGGVVKSSITIQNEFGIQQVDGVFEVTAATANTINLFIPDEEFVHFEGQFAAFVSSFMRTTIVPFKTDRSLLISPPRDELGDIIEIEAYGYNSSLGEGASFSIGSIENDEIVYIETDFLKDYNVANVPFMSVGLDGSNSGVGFVDGLYVDSPGSGYSNGQVVSFSGGGLAGGEPLRQAEAIVATNATGNIAFIQITDHGEGYMQDPIINMPSTGGVAANVAVSMDYGYGFEKNPHGDHDTLLIDLLDQDIFNIGTIASFSSVNPGSGYDASPFVKVYNKYIAGYERRDFFLETEGRVSSYIPGEMLYEEIGGDIFPKGTVISDDGTIVHVKRVFLNTSFTNGEPLIGAISGASGMVVNIVNDLGSMRMGDNADISALVISADGIIKEVEVIDSGWGYTNNGEAVLRSDDSNYIVDGIIVNEKQGKGSGYWDSFESHPNQESKIQDSDYYQDFSYEIVSSVPFDRYSKLLQNILHMAGTKMFGKFEKNTHFNSSVSTNSNMTVYAPFVPVIDLYGTGVGEIPLHILPENAILDSNNHVVSVTNAGGAGAAFDATFSRADRYTDGWLDINPEIGSFEFNFRTGSRLDFASPIDMHNHRLFVVMAKYSTGWARILTDPVTGARLQMCYDTYEGTGLDGSAWRATVGNNGGQLNNSPTIPLTLDMALYEVELYPGNSLDMTVAFNGAEQTANTLQNIVAGSFGQMTRFGNQGSLDQEVSSTDLRNVKFHEILLLRTDGTNRAAEVQRIREYVRDRYSLDIEA